MSHETPFINDSRPNYFIRATAQRDAIVRVAAAQPGEPIDFDDHLAEFTVPLGTNITDRIQLACFGHKDTKYVHDSGIRIGQRVFASPTLDIEMSESDIHRWDNLPNDGSSIAEEVAKITTRDLETLKVFVELWPA